MALLDLDFRSRLFSFDFSRLDSLDRDLSLLFDPLDSLDLDLRFSGVCDERRGERDEARFGDLEVRLDERRRGDRESLDERRRGDREDLRLRSRLELRRRRSRSRDRDRRSFLFISRGALKDLFY